MASRIKMKQFYNKLTDGSILDELQHGLFAEGQSRGFLDAQRLVRLYSLSGLAPVRDVDFRLLAPFWRSFPLDLGPYRYFFLRAKARVSRNDVPNIPGFCLQYLTERLTGSEHSVLVTKTASLDREITDLASMTDAFSICEREGFLSRTTPDPLADGETHMQVHPLMTLALRQNKFALPSWVTHCVEVAYQRFWVYRSRDWPSKGFGTSAWDVARSQLSYDFANYVTTSNFSFRIRADHPNVYFLPLPGRMAFGIADNPRRMHVVLDILERLLATFGAPLAEKKPSMLLSSWSSAFSMVKTKTNILNEDVLSDTRGMLEMTCMSAILYAASFANTLGVPNDYSPLLEGIATNLLPHSYFQNSSLTLLRAARIRLLHQKNPWADRTKALAETMGLSEASLREIGQDRASWSRRVLAPFDYNTLREVLAADSPEEIARVEQNLLDLLEDQLDGVDTARVKELIYESLGNLAFKRRDFPSALQHIDTAMGFAQRLEDDNPQVVPKLLQFRNVVLEAHIANQG